MQTAAICILRKARSTLHRESSFGLCWCRVYRWFYNQLGTNNPASFGFMVQCAALAKGRDSEANQISFKVEY